MIVYLNVLFDRIEHNNIPRRSHIAKILKRIFFFFVILKCRFLKYRHICDFIFTFEKS